MDTTTRGDPRGGELGVMRVDYIAFNEEFINILNTSATRTKALVGTRDREGGEGAKSEISNGVTCPRDNPTDNPRGGNVRY